MKIMLIIVILSSLMYFNDGNIVYRVCVREIKSSYFQALDYKNNSLQLNKILFEQLVTKQIELNLITESNYRYFNIDFRYENNNVEVSIFYQKLIIERHQLIKIGEK